MEKLMEYLETVTDKRQAKKVRHKMSDIIALVFFAMLSNADEWVEIETFGEEHEEFLRKYLELPNGIPSHDTIQRVFGMVTPEFLQGYQKKWNEEMNSEGGVRIGNRRFLNQTWQPAGGNVISRFYLHFRRLSKKV